LYPGTSVHSMNTPVTAFWKSSYLLTTRYTFQQDGALTHL